MPVIEINRDNYEAELLKSNIPTVIDFWGPSCAPCLAMMPKYHELADSPEYSGKLKFCSVNTSTNRRVAVSCRVMSNPTFLFYRDGREVARLSGVKATIEAITAKVQEFSA